MKGVKKRNNFRTQQELDKNETLINVSRLISLETEICEFNGARYIRN